VDRRPSRVLGWVRSRDPSLAALRRAARGAVVMPAMFAVGVEVVGNPAVATFAAFGSFGLVLLVEFPGPLFDRLRSQTALIAAGAAFVCLGTLASRATWLAVVSMAVVGFCVLFAGIVSSVLAAATVSLLLSFILPVSVAAPASQIPDRVAGWAMAGAASLVAITVLWPAPGVDRLRVAATAACRAIAARLRADSAWVLEGGDERRADREAAIAESERASAALSRTFFATPYRPTGLSSSARAVVRLVDELSWLSAILAQSPTHPRGLPANTPACAVKVAAAGVLECGADLLARPRGDPSSLEAVVEELGTALAGVERATAIELPTAPQGSDGRDAARTGAGLVSALDPGFRAQELGFAVSQIAANIGAAAAADRRRWYERLLGRTPAALPGLATSVRQRATSHLEPHSVWLHNSLRGAAGLALAVLVASVTGVQHSFWVILGTLSVLRSNALSTGQNVVRGLLGTAVGVAVGALLLAVIGTNETVLWLLLPLAVLVAGFAPAAVSFEAGQAAFTVTLVILFNIIQPAGWHVGLLRIEDVALGFAVSLLVGVLFWPRGAVTALRRELAESYAEGARYLGAAVEFAIARTDPRTALRPEPSGEADRAAGAARRLDDAFRTYLAERAAKPAPLAEVTGLVNGVAGLRLASDAVVELWRRDPGPATVGNASVGVELRAIARGVTHWYESFADALAGRSGVPAPLDADPETVGRLVDAAGRDLEPGRAGGAAELGARIIWTSDHLDAVRRLQAALAEPASAIVKPPA